jgi:hypothetical protein
MKKNSKKMSGNEPKPAEPTNGANTLTEKIYSAPNNLKSLFQNPKNPSTAGKMFFREKKIENSPKKGKNPEKEYFLPDSEDEDPSDLCKLSPLDQLIAISTCTLQNSKTNLPRQILHPTVNFFFCRQKFGFLYRKFFLRQKFRFLYGKWFWSFC